MSEAKGKILVVDDEESIRTLISRRLMADGHDCTLACNGEEALKTVSTQDFDLVLSDIKMPGLSGLEVLSQIVVEHPDIGVVMISAVADTQTAVEAMKLGAYDYVTKPFELDALSTRVEKALERKILILENRDYKLRDAQEALQDSRKVFQGISEATQDAIIMLDSDGKTTYWNKAAERMFGYTSQEIVGQDLHAAIAPPQYHEAFQKTMGHFKLDGQGNAVGKTLELTGLRRDGREFPVELSLSTVRIRGEWSAVGIVRDVTERRQAEEELQTYKEHLEELVAQRTAELESSQGQLLQAAKLAAIGELVSGVAHEINNPLAAISMYTELLLDEVQDEGALERLRIVNAQAERAIAIVDNLLSFARKHAPKRAYASVNDSITSTVELRAYDLNLDNIKIALDLDPDLPGTMADFRQLQQVFLNLITNAEQALKQARGRGTITIGTQKTDGVIRISVADDGPGIPASALSRVFEPFYTTKDVGKGTGLGLSICHGIVQEHGGQIQVESTEGSGATFIIEMPIITKDAGDEDQRCVPAGSTPVPDLAS
ncbi:MAG: response regulator [Dehalococcoidia bacterium]